MQNQRPVPQLKTQTLGVVLQQSNAPLKVSFDMDISRIFGFLSVFQQPRLWPYWMLNVWFYLADSVMDLNLRSFWLKVVSDRSILFWGSKVSFQKKSCIASESLTSPAELSGQKWPFCLSQCDCAWILRIMAYGGGLDEVAINGSDVLSGAELPTYSPQEYKRDLGADQQQVN